MRHKKKSVKNQSIRAIAIATAIIIIAILVVKKPTITGKAVLGKETIYSENLNIQKNESGIYEWQIKNPGNIKSIKATGSVSFNGSARLYIQKGDERLLLFDSTKQLFDININVLPEYKKVFQGDEILIQITLLNLRGFGSGNVTVDYSIKDSKGKLIASDKESIFVETQAKFVRKLVIPAELKTGTYLAFVEVQREGNILGTGSDTFEVNSKYKYEYPLDLKYYILGLAAVVALIIIFLLIMHTLKAMKKKQKIAELIRMKPQEKIGKLENELKALEQAYKSGFMSQERYRKERVRVEERLKILRK